ncbi:MAG TPA: hypothetical protein VH333_16780 [Pseudonocardiaceae bacterium]|nr:hypothetical protein [Pseudonocardiaceae bacterium]
MIAIESYLRAPDGQFVPAEQAAFEPADDLHIEGAIQLTVNYVDVLDRSLWDDVDQLWAYIANMVESLGKSDSASTYFPDQPIEFAIARVGGGKVRVWSVVGDVTRSSVIDEGRFMTALRAAGLTFFDAMSRLVPANAATYRYSVAKLSQEA